MLKTSLTRKLAALTLAAAPLGAGSSVLASAVVGTPAAHAANVCIGIPGSVTAGGFESSGGTDPCNNSYGPNGANTDTVQINICDGSDSAQPSPSTDPNALPVQAYDPPLVDVWGDLLNGPQGVAEVDGIGIASEQSGC